MGAVHVQMRMFITTILCSGANNKTKQEQKTEQEMVKAKIF